MEMFSSTEGAPESTKATAETEILVEGPVEAVEPFVNPPMDPGYHPPPLEPVPYEDPFATIPDQTLADIRQYFAQLHGIPWKIVQNAHKKLMGVLKGHRLSPAQKHLLESCLHSKGDPCLALQACSLQELGQLQEALQELGRQKMPNHPSSQLLQEQQSLQLLYHIVATEGLRRNL